ncbi:adenine nucleotide alpha hydrolases-like protein [Tilletiopsis washingtonensis]|uniref:Adenine nucleotide alpha hydrolases-like protein n=1 Tax=Tilletiopsis washingtonensis TaxID=58919 RepID=A0A316ZEM1_9BASI|nr:adenine nucleotide alpha hydrolases-like protein [Tilletiopsis washingtonensis]PWN99971.1 adenine nucleotide alpha hydrolases-like protein [Tilletiopsis washingtonensis]
MTQSPAPAPVAVDVPAANGSGSAGQSEPSSPAKKLFASVASLHLPGGRRRTHAGAADGTATPTHEHAQTPALESSNPFDRRDVPDEARTQAIVGATGAEVKAEGCKVMLALDGTEAGDKALKWLLETKVVAKGAHVFIASVLPANVLSGPWVSGPLSIDARQQNVMLKALREEAVEKLQPYKAQLRAAGYATTTHVLHGDPRQSLVRVAQYHEVDLVVCGKRTRKGLHGLGAGVGATSTHLTQHAPCPVLTIK